MMFKHVSRAMSKALRHEPEFLGIKLDEQGWVDASELYDALLAKFPTMHDFRFERLEDIIRDCQKQRFAWNEDHTKIRANQGHSIGVDLKLEPQKAPEILYHGTAIHVRPLILKNGLLRMNRQHVHLSVEQETAVKVGSRHGKPTVFVVRAKEHQDETGAEYFMSDNGVWLTEHVPPKFLA
jgi:putative RNA 2'-phosphotransferase